MIKVDKTDRFDIICRMVGGFLSFTFKILSPALMSEIEKMH